MKANILIVDDELVICKSCEKIFKRAGHEVVYTTSGREAIIKLESETYDVVFTDLKMIDIGGMEVLQTIKQKYPQTVVVVITGYASIASAVETMRHGAFDYLPKPFTPAELIAVLDRALEKRMTILTISRKQLTDYSEGFEEFKGKSPRIYDVYELIKKVAPTESTVLIIGESGTGKDLTARAIHNLSNRKQNKCISIDVSTLSPSLIESELFGHVKGSFTGAYANKEGIFEAADGGTIFLDEIGNLPLNIQSMLLRVLQEKEFIPVGSTTVKKVDVRLIFATNRDLKSLVSEGKFREDLYYRLNVFPIKLPPLRERREDIPELADYFLKKYCEASNKPVPRLNEDSLQLLLNYHWPGNVRELEHTMERLSIIIEEDEIQPVHISSALFQSELISRSVIPKSSEELKTLKKKIRENSVQQLEKLFIEEALIRNNWNISKASRDVNMQRSNFQALIRKYKIKRNPHI